VPVKNRWFAFLALNILLAAAYGPSLNHFFLSDDFSWLAKAKSGSLLQPLTEGLNYSGIYRPIFYLYIQANYSIFGVSPLGWNIFQLLLHAVNCLLLVWLLNHYFKNYWMGFFVAVCFALHFINVEAVIWLSAASYTLATFFALVTLLLYVQFRETGRRIPYFTSFLSALLALFSNEQAIGLLLILVLFEFRFPAPLSGRFRILLPYFLIIGLFAGFRLFALDFRPPGGAYHPAAGLNFVKNYLFLTVGSLFRLDFMKLLDHWRAFQTSGDFNGLIANLTAKPSYMFALICASLAYMAVFWYSPTSRFFILWGFLALLPVALFAGTGERLLYLSLTGLSAIIPIWIHNLSEKLDSKKLFYLLAIIWIGYLFGMQQLTVKNWRSASAVTQKTVRIIGQTAQAAGRPVTVCVERTPDHYYEAWVFRMGFEQLGELFYPEGLIETKQRSQKDCPADSNRRLFFGEFRNYQFILEPSAQK
jgi:hypothetical protein